MLFTIFPYWSKMIPQKIFRSSTIAGVQKCKHRILSRSSSTTSTADGTAATTVAAATALALGGIVAMAVTEEGQAQQQHHKMDVKDQKRPMITSLPRLPITNFRDKPQHYTSCDASDQKKISRFFPRLRRNKTLRRMEDTSTKQTLQSKYDVQWNHPLGEGGFGTVFIGEDSFTGEQVAVKKLPKAFTNQQNFQKEMNAFLHIRDKGGHPNICALRENFDEGEHFYLVFDLISGGEMFDHLCCHGAYSEADAARLVREIGSALAFLHGIGLIHGDLKPENLMLSSENSSDAVIKLVDFGCAQVVDKASPLYDDTIDNSEGKNKVFAAITPGYSPPEIIGSEARNIKHLEPSMDMFSLGIIVYVMLTGIHPFDLSGLSSDQEINERVKSCKKCPPPLRNSPITAHLSPSAIDLIEKLIEPNPKRRLTAQQMLDHPWVKGETARTGKIAYSDEKLSAYRRYKTKIEAQVFSSMVGWAEENKRRKASSSGGDRNNVTKRTSLIERSFQMLDPERKGYITKQQLSAFDDDTDTTDRKQRKGKQHTANGDDDSQHLSLSGFSDLLSENMKNRYYPAGHIVYREGEKGNKMYFINSGRIEISTKDGHQATSEQGDFFGEGALMSKKGRRSATVKCVTPVHAIEISREYLDKYLAKGGYGAKLTLAETAKARKRNRAKTILSLQKSLEEITIGKGDFLYQKNDAGDDIFILGDGSSADVVVDDHTVYKVNPGELCGEFPIVFGRPRNTSARCTSNTCTLHILKSKDFHKLLRTHPSLKDTLRDITLRREFQKALVFAIDKPFPLREYELRATFEAADSNNSGKLDLSDITLMLKNFDKDFTDSEIKDILNSLDLDGTGAIHWEEFKRIFGMAK